MKANRQKSVKEQLQGELELLTEKILTDLSTVDASCAKELLSDFVSGLFLAFADQQRKEERREKQTAGIEAAKARGVKFGRAANPLPDNFSEVRLAWRDKKYTLQQAADACGMPCGTFYAAAVRAEQAENRPV